MARSALGPGILVQPQSVIETEGNTATFSVSATGSAPLGYQWLFNNSPIPGATASTLVLDGISPGDAGNYTAVISNSVAAATSAPASLQVISRPHIVASWNKATGRFKLSFAADPARSSTIWASIGLENWTSVVTFAPGSGTIFWEDDTGYAVRFYRLEQP